jgi:hypothetical protein
MAAAAGWMDVLPVSIENHFQVMEDLVKNLTNKLNSVSAAAVPFAMTNGFSPPPCQLLFSSVLVFLTNLLDSISWCC